MPKAVLVAVLCLAALAAAPVRAETAEPEKPTRRFLAIPYPFYNDTIGSGIGVAAIAEGYVQPRMLAVGSGLFSAQGTYLGFVMVRNYQVPWLERLILEPQASVGELRKIESYVNGNPDFPNERAGSNGSSKDNFVEADGSDGWAELRMRYVLPLGEGKTDPLPRPSIENGVPVAGSAKPWNPLGSGRTAVELTPFYRNQVLEDENNTTQTTFGFDAALAYDSTDYRSNPSSGAYQRLFLSRDWGGFGSTSPWTVAGADLTQYVSLGASRLARQRVLVFNFWTVDCLTWDAGHRSPAYKGASLGGLYRMRGYPATRYNDRSAVYYGAEYRHTLGWNPLKEITLGGRLDMDWLQLVAFGELGRVAAEWDLGTLHSHMKWSTGAGLRAMVNHLVVRADLGISEEDAIVQLFIGHPF